MGGELTPEIKLKATETTAAIEDVATPFFTMYNVRSSSQFVKADMLVGLLQERWSAGI